MVLIHRLLSTVDKPNTCENAGHFFSVGSTINRDDP